MKIVRVLLAFAILTAAAACGRSSVTEPDQREPAERRNNVGHLGSGWIATDPDSVPSQTLQD